MQRFGIPIETGKFVPGGFKVFIKPQTEWSSKGGFLLPNFKGKVSQKGGGGSRSYCVKIVIIITYPPTPTTLPNPIPPHPTPTLKNELILQFWTIFRSEQAVSTMFSLFFATIFLEIPKLIPVFFCWSAHLMITAIPIIGGCQTRFLLLMHKRITWTWAANSLLLVSPPSLPMGIITLSPLRKEHINERII